MGDENDLNLDNIGDIVLDLGEYDFSDTIDTSYYHDIFIGGGAGMTTVSSGAGGGTGISSGAGYTIGTSSINSASWVDASINNTMNVNGNVVINEEGDIKLGDRSLKEFMAKMEDRLAILVPDPAKLEKFEALKKAYDHYKMMEKLCEIENKDEEK